MDIFKGQISWEDLTQHMTYKEAVRLRDIRVKRKSEQNSSLETALAELQ
jgi:hypothetical protein